MTVATVSGVRIAGLASAIPTTQSTVDDMANVFGEEIAQKISKNTGVQTRYIVDENICTSDLCVAATERLLDDLEWDRETISLIIFVSQTSDYILPATATSIHGRLGLSKSCSAFDINLGCSGYVYGLWTIAQLMGSGIFERALLLVGDTSSHLISKLDRGTAPLFGDAGTVTALEKHNHAQPMYFDLGTDGNGTQHLIVPAGGCRIPHSQATAQEKEYNGGNIRSENNLYMNGTEIFTFTLREVPSMLQRVLDHAQWRVEEIDAFVFHQANLFIINHLAKRMKLDKDKVPLSIKEFGNTSSASIPLTMTHALPDTLRAQSTKLVMAGFGVGFSWGSVAITCSPMIVSDLVMVS